MTNDLIYASRDFRAAYLSETARAEALNEGRNWRRAKRIARQVFERESGRKVLKSGVKNARQRTTMGGIDPASNSWWKRLRWEN